MHAALRYQLFDSADYFFNNVERLGEPDYSPTNQASSVATARMSGEKKKK